MIKIPPKRIPSAKQCKKTKRYEQVVRDNDILMSDIDQVRMRKRERKTNQSFCVSLQNLSDYILLYYFIVLWLTMPNDVRMT